MAKNKQFEAFTKMFGAYKKNGCMTSCQRHMCALCGGPAELYIIPPQKRKIRCAFSEK